ncbi:MAG TPA: helix-turn-helix transcriptional regulator [Gaiellaceae bacterium]|nr:helix-turn-helix transcriptional regulator [Gaiellaceae bacterium]
MIDPGKLAENVRRAAGMHLVSLDALAAHVGMSRGGIMKIVADSPKGRTVPSGPTMVKLAEAFGVDARVLLDDETAVVLQHLAEAFEDAPVRAIAKVPGTWQVIAAGGVTQLGPPMKRKRAPRGTG